jgi:hypothetical protein
MRQLQGGVWSTTVFIPDNPETKSHQQFKYDSKLDALTYGRELASEILEVTKAIVIKVPDKNSS